MEAIPPAAAPEEGGDSESRQEIRRAGIHRVLMATAFAAFVASYVGVQYFIARRQVVMFMQSMDRTIEDVHIDKIELKTAWSVQVWWVFRDKDEPGNKMTLPTETSLLGLGSTEINRYVLQAE